MRFTGISVVAVMLSMLATVFVSGSAQAGGPNEDVLTSALDGQAKKKTKTMTSGDLDRASATMSRLGNHVVAELSAQNLKREERVEFYRDLVSGNLDTQVLARFMLGNNWQGLTGPQRTKYLAAFTDYLVHTYAIRLGGIEVNKFEIQSSTFSGKAKQDILVNSKISSQRSKPIHAVWRLRPRGGKFVILDLVVEGVSMALTTRQEFSAILARTGNVDGLIKTLKERMA
ncbi:MAG: ABC transporter substrate-binding protein [Rhodospirillales bacterium]|nr:ABC transporter substrate-binding protein [Rhodospirillales bacterium]